MDLQKRDKFTNMTLGEWIERVPNELPIDAIGVWQIIPALRSNFELNDSDIDSGARLVIERILARGAWPVTGSPSGPRPWKKFTHYGYNPGEIIDSVIIEWRQSGKDPGPGDLWFALPKFFE